MLGVEPGASEKELSRAYKNLAKQHHPDANAGNPEAEERFKEVNAAYDVLGDTEKRKEYDEVRRMVASGVGPGGFAPGGGKASDRAACSSISKTRVASATCWATSSVGAVAGAAARTRRSAVRISRPSCTSRSTTPCTASRARFASAPTRCARRVTAPAPLPGHCPRRARSAAVPDRSRSTRARSRSPRCARRAAAAGRSFPRRARRVADAGSRRAPAR